MKVVGPDSPEEIPVHGAGTTSVQIPGLRPFTSYTFSVSAMTKAGTGPAATISSKTPEGCKTLTIKLYSMAARIILCLHRFRTQIKDTLYLS